MAIIDATVTGLITGRLGSNGDTTYVDEFGLTWTGAGGCQLSNSSPLYAPLSLTIPNTTGSTNWALPNASAAGFVLGAGDFRVRLWVDQTTALSEAVYIDNDGQNGTAGWRVGLYNSSGSTYALYWYSDVGGFFNVPLSVSPGGNGPRFFQVERVGSGANNCSIYDGTTRVMQYTDTTNYSRQATNVLLGRGANNLAFRPFQGKIGGVQVQRGASGTFTASGSTLPAIPSPYDALSSDVSLALTGQDIAAAQGTINDTINRALTSGSITAAQGTVARATAYGLTGQDITAAAGTVTVGSGSPDVTLALTGLDLTASQGAVTVDASSPDVTKALTGQALGLAQGDLTASGGDAPAGRNGGAEFTKGRGPVPTRSFTPILQRMLEARGRKVKPQGERRQVRAKTIEVEAADAILEGADEQAMRDAMARWLAQGIMLPAGADPLDLFLAQVLFRLQQRRIAEQQAEDMVVRAALERAARQENDAVMALLLA